MKDELDIFKGKFVKVIQIFMSKRFHKDPVQLFRIRIQPGLTDPDPDQQHCSFLFPLSFFSHRCLFSCLSPFFHSTLIPPNLTIFAFHRFLFSYNTAQSVKYSSPLVFCTGTCCNYLINELILLWERGLSVSPPPSPPFVTSTIERFSNFPPSL